MSRRPADECPFARPFPPGFHDCAAFRGVEMAARDSRQRPLRPEHTCAHLEVGSSRQAGRFYARCGLGSAADRQRWAVAHGGPPATAPEDARGLSADIRGTPQRRIRAPR